VRRGCYNQSMSEKTTKSAQEFPGQHEGETVQMLFRQHPLVMRKQLILGLFAILLGVLPLDFPQVYSSEQLSGFFIKGALIIPVLVLAWWFWRWVGWYYTIYIVTSRRIMEIKQKGFFNRQVEEWQLSDITNVNYKIGGFQAVLFAYGDITAKSYVGTLEMKTIHKPAEIHEQLVQAVRRGGGGSTQVSN
jgi:signal transduction histidine kinase